MKKVSKHTFGINKQLTKVLKGKVSKAEVDESLDILYRESKRMSHEHA
jgi:hypothetical protein